MLAGISETQQMKALKQKPISTDDLLHLCSSRQKPLTSSDVTFMVCLHFVTLLVLTGKLMTTGPEVYYSTPL